MRKYLTSLKSVTALLLVTIVSTTIAFAGENVIQTKSIASVREAAEHGDSNAQCKLGWMYSNGDEVEQNYEEAAKWFLRAAGQGNADAQHILGRMYRNGQGVEKDDVEASKWYRKAAEQGNALAQYNLGVMYKNGQGVSQDYVEAIKWYRLAAEQGHAKAQYSLGAMYRNGQGVEKDSSVAKYWYAKAAEHKHDGATRSSAQNDRNGDTNKILLLVVFGIILSFVGLDKIFKPLWGPMLIAIPISVLVVSSGVLCGLGKEAAALAAGSNIIAFLLAYYRVDDKPGFHQGIKGEVKCNLFIRIAMCTAFFTCAFALKDASGCIGRNQLPIYSAGPGLTLYAICSLLYKWRNRRECAKATRYCKEVAEQGNAET